MGKEELINIRDDMSKDEYSDIWRKSYDEISCSDQVEIETEYYNHFIFPYFKKKGLELKTMGTFPEANPIFENKYCMAFFDYICSKKTNIKVVEFGGLLGNMARYILDKHGDNIKEWINYEVVMHSITKNQCNHPQYTAIVASKFFWEMDIKKDFDVFVAAHSIEHIKTANSTKLLEKINEAEYIYLEAPIFDDSTGWTEDTNVNTFFGGKCGTTHILSIGFEQISKMLKNYKVIENLSKPYIIETEKNKKIIRYMGRPVVITFPDEKSALRLPGRGILKYDDGRTLGAIRCYEQKEKEFDEGRLEQDKFMFGEWMRKNLK